MNNTGVRFVRSEQKNYSLLHGWRYEYPISRLKRFLHSQSGGNSGCESKDCDNPHRGSNPSSVGDLSNQHRTDGISKISPKAVDAHG